MIMNWKNEYETLTLNEAVQPSYSTVIVLLPVESKYVGEVIV